MRLRRDLCRARSAGTKPDMESDLRRGLLLWIESRSGSI
jgi:hypothetical protein